MFETENIVLSVFEGMYSEEMLLLCLKKYTVVGILTNSVERFLEDHIYQQMNCHIHKDCYIYDYNEVYRIRDKIVVLDLDWTDDLRLRFGNIFMQFQRKIAVNFIYESMQNGKVDTNIVFELMNRDIDGFKRCIQLIADGRKMCIIYGNCQSHTISSMLCTNREFRSRFFTCVMPQFWLQGTAERTRMETLVQSQIFNLASYLITQEVSENNRFGVEFSTDYIKSFIPAECKVITISNLFFMGYFPQYKKMKYGTGINFFHGKLLDATEYMDINILKMIIDDKTDGDILNEVTSQSFYNRGELIASIQKELDDFKLREATIDIKMGDYVADNYNKYLLFATSNHPTRLVLMELSRRILAALDFKDCEILCSQDEIQEPMPKNWRYLVYSSVLHCLGMERDLEYNFKAVLNLKEIALIPDDIRITEARQLADNTFHITVSGDFLTYMRIYVRCVRAALMLL